jgi:hypothetical protein
MQRIEEQQNTLMYISRLLHNHTSKDDASKRALVFTIQVEHLYNTNHVKKAIFQKVHRAIYGKLSSPNDFNFSMFIASDVESSRAGSYLPNKVLLKPLLPHYHGLIVFNKPDWDQISKNIPSWKGIIRSSISDIYEVKEDEVDEFEERNVKGTKHQFPLGNYTQYAMKAHLQGVNRSILLHEPSVFPFDIYASEQDVVKSNHLFNKLWKQQVDYVS